MSRALLDSLELPHWLILSGILLVIAGVIGLVIDRKKLGKVDDIPANEASSETRPQLPPPRRERRQAAADGDPEMKAKRE
jgi:hypothetical protein